MPRWTHVLLALCTVTAGDVLEIVEPEHEGSAGWTRVRNAANSEGLVPTSYLNITP